MLLKEMFKNSIFLGKLWKLEYKSGVIGIEANSSCCFLSLIDEKIFNLIFPKLNYGGCSLMAEWTAVVRRARVRFSAVAVLC